jgi:hypothetical protein
VLIAALSAIMARQHPRSIAGVLLAYLVPVLLIAFGSMFIAALGGISLFPSRPILRFALPIFLTVLLLAASFLIGVSLAGLFHP